MSKRTLTCSCGLEMQVPESAIGRTGLCPECGAEIAITEENTREYAPPRNGGGLLKYKQQKHEVATTNNDHREEAWRKFANAVDLYNSRRYAEALTILNGLQQTFPGNEHIETARQQCLEALQLTMSDTREYDGRLVQNDYLNADLVRSVILDKLMNGATEDVQLQAAELAAKMLGMFPGAAPQPPEREALPPPPAMPELPAPDPPAMMLAAPEPVIEAEKKEKSPKAKRRRTGKPRAKRKG